MTDTPHASSTPSPEPLPPEGSDASGYPFTFYLPDLGEGLRSGEIIEWLISEGQQVELDQVLVVVETAKSTVEIPSPVAGTVVRLLEPVGQVVDVDAPLIELRTPTPQTQAPTAGAETPRRIQPISSPPNPARERANTWWAGAKCPLNPAVPVPRCRQNPPKLKAARLVRVPKFRPPCAGSPVPSGSI